MTTKTKSGLDFIKTNAPELHQRFLGVEDTGQPNIVTLTAADLAVLDTVPFELVPAPGAGKAIIQAAYSWVFKLNGGLSPQTDTSDEGVSLAPYYGTSEAQAAAALMLMPVFPVTEDKLGWDTYGYSNAGSAQMVSLADAKNAALRLTCGANLQVPGAPSTTTLNDGGTGYATNDTFTVDDGLGTLATGHVSAQSDGVVTAFILDTKPNGYFVADGIDTTATSGSGSGLKINITALNYGANAITLTIKTTYATMDV